MNSSETVDKWRENKVINTTEKGLLSRNALPALESTVVHSSECPRLLGNPRGFGDPKATDSCTVGPARVSRLHKPSLSFTLQFRKNFKLARLLNTGRLGKSSQFRAACPPPPPRPR